MVMLTYGHGRAGDANGGGSMNEKEKAGKLVVEIPDVVETMANDSEAIGRNAVRLSEKHDEPMSESSQPQRRAG
jgi:hypothetical protein